MAYLVVLAGVCSALHVWKLPPALPALQKELGLTLVESGFLLSLVQMGGMALGLAMGLVAEKIGLRRCVLLGLLLLSAGSMAGAVSSHKAALLALRGVEGCGFLMVIMPAPTLIRRLVQPARLSRLLGVWGCYIPIGTIIVLLGGSWILSVSNWRVLWWLLAGITLVMVALLWKLLPPDPSRARRDPAMPGGASAWGIVKSTLSCESIWLVGLCFGVYAGQWIAVIGFLPTIYALGGISGPLAGVLTAIVAGFNATGCFAAGRLLHRGVRARTLMITGYATMAAMSFVAFGLHAPVAVQFFSVLVFSAVGGLIPTTLFWLAIELAPSPQTTSSSVGLMQQLSAAGQFAGPPVVAWVATLAGGWQWTWLATGLCAAAGVAMTLRLAARNRARMG